MTVEAVLLDAGGVLLLPDADVVERELTSVGIEPERSRFERAHHRGMRAVDLDPSEGVRWEVYTAAYVRELGIPEASDVAARDAVGRAFQTMDWTVVIESSLRALPALAARGVHLALVSNSDGTVERMLRETRMAQVGVGAGAEMVAIIDSHLVGVEKPDPRIFEIALEIIGVGAEHAIHVGDSVRFDVVGARNAGVRPIHLDPFGFCPDTDHEHARELAEVVSLL
jgi:putative hydrolase of the HAD superfamily